jgi:hypothetical protein
LIGNGIRRRTARLAFLFRVGEAPDRAADTNPAELLTGLAADAFARSGFGEHAMRFAPAW